MSRLILHQQRNNNLSHRIHIDTIELSQIMDIRIDINSLHSFFRRNGLYDLSPSTMSRIHRNLVAVSTLSQIIVICPR